MKKVILILSVLISTFFVHSQKSIWIKPNKGQWHQNIEYKIGIPAGDMYLEKEGFTYSFSNINSLHNHEYSATEFDLKTAVVRTNFINSNVNPTFKEIGRSNHYENYFIGNDPSRWVNHLYLYNEINYLNIYQGIDLYIYESNTTLKYDIIIAPNVDPSQFKLNSPDNIKLKL